MLGINPTLRCHPHLLQRDLSGKTYIVTGANSGAGLATARQLVKQGAHVVGGCRRVDAGEEAFAGFNNLRGTSEVMRLDLASLSSVRAFAEEFNTRFERLDGLANNAGGVFPEGKTEDGFEMTFGVNHLGPFLLTHLLLDKLKNNAPSRVVCVSSVVHAGRGKYVPEIHYDDLDFEKRDYSAMQAYSEAKLAVVLFASQLARELDGTGVSVFSVHPGWVRSNFGRTAFPRWVPGWAGAVMNVILRPLSKPLGIVSPHDGAQSTLHCLLDDNVLTHSGEYFSQMSILYPNRSDRPGGWPMRSPNLNARDENEAKDMCVWSDEVRSAG